MKSEIPTVLVTGASGLLGRAVMAEFARRPSARSCHVVGTVFRAPAAKEPQPNLVRVDLTDSAAVTDLFARLRPAAVVHCAALRSPDQVAADEPAASRLNVASTRLLADLCSATSTRLIYISTDYVYDGSAERAVEHDDCTNPLNAYARTKLAGEKEALEATAGKAIVLRVPLLYGRLQNPLHCAESAVSVLLDTVRAAAALEKTHLAPRVDAAVLRYPTLTDDVARVIADLVMLPPTTKSAENTSSEACGVFLFTAKQPLTKANICDIFARLLGFNLPADALVRVRANETSQQDPQAATTSSVRRPGHIFMSTARLEAFGIDVSCTPFESWWVNYLAETSSPTVNN